MNYTKLILLIIFLILFVVLLPFLFTKKEKYQKSTLKVWTYWEPSPPPEIVQKCYNNWKKMDDLKINFLNPNNVTQYIPKTEYNRISKNSENLAVKSDFIGLYLLKTHGGVWIDGSVFLNKPLTEWLPPSKFFTYRADRFGKMGLCMETFFISSPKNHIIVHEWYNLLHNIIETPGKEKFIEFVNQKYPLLTDEMDSDYLWVYVAGKFLLAEKPYLKKFLVTKSAEKGPWYESEKYGWDNIEQICEILEKNGPCNDCEMTKLHNGMRKKCSSNVVT